MIDVIYAAGWTSQFTWVVVAGFLVCVILAFGMGANDCANSYGTVVGSRVLKLWQAYAIATFTETAGAALLGYRVTNTMRKFIVELDEYDIYAVTNATGTYSVPAVNRTECHNWNTTFNDGSTCTIYSSPTFLVGELAALIGTAAWLIIATLFHMPVSTTQSAVGATVGFSLVVKGAKGIHWGTIVNIVLSWVISPLMAGGIGSIFYLSFKFFALKRKNPFEAALRMLPFIFWFAIAVNGFSIFYGGSKYLHFNVLTWWQSALISTGIGGLVALFVWFKGVPYIRARALRLQEHEDKYGARRDPVDASSPFTIIKNKCCKSGQNDADERTCELGAVVGSADGTSTSSLVQRTVHQQSSAGRGATNRGFNGTDEARANSRKNSTESQTESGSSGSDANSQPPRQPQLRFKLDDESGNVIADEIVLNAAPLNDLGYHSASDSPYYPGTGACSGAALMSSPNKSLPGGVLPQGRPVDPTSLYEKLVDLTKPMKEDPLVVKVFDFLQILSATFLSFSHGSNDTANSVGSLAGLWLAYKYGFADVVTNDPTLEYIILFGAISMVIGLWILGHKVIQTVGDDLTEITSPTGFCIELASAFTILLGSLMSIPLSTTHCMVGAVVIVGYVRTRKNGVSWKMFGNIIIAWVVTIPVAAGVSAFVTYLLVKFYLGFPI